MVLFYKDTDCKIEGCWVGQNLTTFEKIMFFKAPWVNSFQVNVSYLPIIMGLVLNPTTTRRTNDQECLK